MAVLRRLRPLLDGLPEDLQRGSPDIAWGRLGTVTKLAEQRPERLTGDLVWRTLARDLPGVPRAAGLWQARHFQAAERKTISRRLTLSRARGR